MPQELDIRLSPRSLVNPYRPLIVWGWGIKQYALWAKKAGYISLEFCPFWRPTAQVMQNAKKIPENLPPIKSICANTFNPYALLKTILGEEPDPLHPNKRFFHSRVIYSTPRLTRQAIQRILSQSKDMPVVVDQKVASKFNHALIYYPNENHEDDLEKKLCREPPKGLLGI